MGTFREFRSAVFASAVIACLMFGAAPTYSAPTSIAITDANYGHHFFYFNDPEDPLSLIHISEPTRPY